MHDRTVAMSTVASESKPVDRMSQPTLSVLIPVYNEAAALPELIGRLEPVLAQLDVAWEVIFVDDGSTDETLTKIRDTHALNPQFRAISLSRNFGKEIATAAGLRYVRGRAVVLMDADLQHPPETISEFIERWREGYQVVFGQRIDRKTDGPLRRFFSKIFYRTYNALVDADIPEGAGDFRLLDRRAVDALNSIGERTRFNKGLYSWIGFKSVGVPYTVVQRRHGRSKWSFTELFTFAVDGLTSFTTIPLRVWSLLGVIISLFALVYAGAFLFRTLVFGIDLPGFPSLIISVMFFSGVQLISLGVLGQYIGRIYEEVKARPLFFVAEELGTEEYRSPRASAPGEQDVATERVDG
ncbi:MAG: glycosyltransferase family 2 protein [Hyphomicrobiaceae bacterium]